MKYEEIQRIKEFYELVIFQGIIKPVEINDIYCLINPEEQNPMGVAYRVKQRAISLFIGNLQQQVVDEMQDLFKSVDSTEIVSTEIDSTEIATTVGSAASTDAEQSHSEAIDTHIDKPKRKRNT